MRKRLHGPRAVAYAALIASASFFAPSCVVPISLGSAGTVFVIFIPVGASRTATIKRAYLERFKCSEGTVRKIARHRYEASGCGPTRTFTCHGSRCEQDEPDFDTSPARAWVERTYREANGCRIASVWRVSPGLYEARGCGPDRLYYCPVDEPTRARCRPHDAGDPLPTLEAPARARPRKPSKPRRPWR